MMKKFRNKILLVSVVFMSIFSFSFVDVYFEASKNLDIFATLFRELNIYYVDETNPGDLMKKGIDAMLKSLDPYTSYIPESDIEEYKVATTGQYGGIGALIRKKDKFIMISDRYEGFAADKAGLKSGDVIFFDEFNVPMHEYKAFTEWANSFYIDYEVIGTVNNFYQLALKIK